MESITQILESLHLFSKQNFKFTLLIEPLTLLKKAPNHISFEPNNEDFIFHLNQAYNHIDWLNDLINSNLTKLLKKEINELKNYKPKDSIIPILTLLLMNHYYSIRIYLLN